MENLFCFVLFSVFFFFLFEIPDGMILFSKCFIGGNV